MNPKKRIVCLKNIEPFKVLLWFLFEGSNLWFFSNSTLGYLKLCSEAPTRAALSHVCLHPTTLHSSQETSQRAPPLLSAMGSLLEGIWGGALNFVSRDFCSSYISVTHCVILVSSLSSSVWLSTVIFALRRSVPSYKWKTFGPDLMWLIQIMTFALRTLE